MNTDLVMLQAETKSAFAFDNPFAEDDLTEDLTLVEPITQKVKSKSFYLFLHSPYFSPTLYMILKKYFKEVRQRMIESREFDRRYYSHTVYQKSRSLVRNCYIYMRNNLRQ